jgi:hypothetical protein
LETRDFIDSFGSERVAAEMIPPANERGQAYNLNIATRSAHNSVARRHACGESRMQVREVRDLRKAKWEMALDAHLRRARQSRREIDRSPKSAPWKIRIAREMKRSTTATNPWLAAALGMGHPSRVCHLISDI